MPLVKEEPLCTFRKLLCTLGVRLLLLLQVALPDIDLNVAILIALSRRRQTKRLVEYFVDQTYIEGNQAC